VPYIAAVAFAKAPLTQPIIPRARKLSSPFLACRFQAVNDHYTRSGMPPAFMASLRIFYPIFTTIFV
jgi:hypothetical protein